MYINFFKSIIKSIFNQKTKMKKEIPKGRRANSGRKPVDDKKQQLCVYKEESKILKLGGKEAVQKLMSEAVDTAFENKIYKPKGKK